ncbi:hypothetical protein [Actinomadura rudentiformis]|uniref:Uncharacterized protein n=1 Tax=Actinomadura rudentiformis TaxID=359158 RepID=A0A6H9YDD1_9ACTN|nr:hypothetical protein [Actinomadura rudentiformis]KAB2342188.1 hypothetical protein F8566_39715 [Actinomadura rudentiformis]
MTRRTAHSKLDQRGLLTPTGMRATIHSWVALTCVIELYAEGIHRLALTLPVVIIALLDAWREFRATPRMSDNSNASLNHGENPSEGDPLKGVSRFLI